MGRRVIDYNQRKVSGDGAFFWCGIYFTGDRCEDIGMDLLLPDVPKITGLGGSPILIKYCKFFKRKVAKTEILFLTVLVNYVILIV